MDGSLKQTEAFDLLAKHIDEAVALFGVPLLERLEAAFLIIGNRDPKMLLKLAKKAGFEAATNEAISQMAVILQEQWLKFQIDQQKAREKPSEGNEPKPTE